MRTVLTKYLVIFLLFLTAVGCKSLDTTEKSASVENETTPKNCFPIGRDAGFFSTRATITTYGKNCLIEDFVQRHRFDFIDSRGDDLGSPKFIGVISFLSVENVDLDLQNHLVTGSPFDNTLGIGTTKGRNIKVHNGLIKNPGPLSIGIALGPYKTRYQYIGNSQPPEDQAPMRKRKFLKDNSYIYSDPWDYKPSTNFHLENLKIMSGGRGVILVGADNSLRNSTVEVDGTIAAYLYGPRTVIEGNTFIVHLERNDTDTLPAILKLRDADGAIIRNNRFIVKTRFGRKKAPAAINLLESKNVTIENNTIEGAETFLRKDAESTTSERGNIIN